MDPESQSLEQDLFSILVETQEKEPDLVTTSNC
jgi:hypothetical protein